MDASELVLVDLPVPTPHQITIQKWMFFQQLFLKSSLLLNGSCGIRVSPSKSSDNLCLLFFKKPPSMFETIYDNINLEICRDDAVYWCYHLLS